MLLSGLRIGENYEVTADNEDDDMILYHMYSWHEAIDANEEMSGNSLRLKRLTIDILLPGPTILDQLKAVVSADGKTLHFTYKPPMTYLSHNRTAVRVTGHTMGARAIPVATQAFSAASRVQSHRNVLEQVIPEQREKIRHIKLPFQCDQNFCRRDDWGRDNLRHGMEIGVYRHEDQGMQNDNQFVWILHVELSAAERAMVLPMSPGGIGQFHNYA